MVQVNNMNNKGLNEVVRPIDKRSPHVRCSGPIKEEAWPVYNGFVRPEDKSLR